jgi:hypothetical protein
MSTNKIGFTEGSGINIGTHSFSEGGLTKHIERVAPGTGTLTAPVSGSSFLDSISTITLYPTAGNPIDISGKARVTIKTSFSTASATADFKILMYDSANTLMGILPSVSEVYTAISSSSEQDNSRYIGSMYLFSNDGGMSGIKIRLSTISTGNISFYIGGI